MNLTLTQIALALGVSIDAGGVATGWSTDSRTIAKGDFFFPLHGPNFDGHAHLAEAFRKGAIGAVVDCVADGSGLTIRVADTLTAMQTIAVWKRVMAAISAT